jgi:hypothetical protein
MVTLSILASLIITGCSRGMKSRDLAHPTLNPVAEQTLSDDVNPQNTEPNDNTTMEPPDEQTAHNPAIEKPRDKSETDPAAAKKPVTPAIKTAPEKKTTQPTTNKTENQSAPKNPVTTLLNFIPLIWEKTVMAAKGWTQYIYSVIKKEESYLLGQNVADDIEVFCPTYRNLNELQRLNFWGQFFASLAYHESSWNPVSRRIEESFKNKDPVTQMKVASEGLLQLSYQDEKSYRLDCGFDWNKDKNLAEKDPRKTILNPYNNLRCGIKIMSIQLKKYRTITMPSNVYWAVLKTNGRYSKISQIAKATRSLKICQMSTN